MRVGRTKKKRGQNRRYHLQDVCFTDWDHHGQPTEQRVSSWMWHILFIKAIDCMCRKRTSDRGERRGEACAHMVHAAVAAAAAYFAWRVAASVPSSTSSRSSSLHTSAFFCDLSVSETKPHNLSLPGSKGFKFLFLWNMNYFDLRAKKLVCGVCCKQ